MILRNHLCGIFISHLKTALNKSFVKLKTLSGQKDKTSFLPLKFWSRLNAEPPFLPVWNLAAQNSLKLLKL